MTDPVELLRDLEQGAEVYLANRTTVNPTLTSVQRAAYNMFLDAAQDAIEANEAHLHVFALVLAGESVKARDVLRDYVAPEEDYLDKCAREWDNAADRGYDTAKENGDA